MKHLFIASAALLAMVSANAAGTYMMAPMDADPGVVDPDSTGFTFTDVKILPTTPVKDQNKSGIFLILSHSKMVFALFLFKHFKC